MSSTPKYWFAFNPQLFSFNNFGKYGDFFYGIYLYGIPVQQVLIAILGASTSLYLLMPLSIVVSLLLAYISWIL